MMRLAFAQAVIAGGIARARADAMKPIGLIVLDAGGHPVASAREDGASFGRLEIARAKAYGALAMGDETAAIAERAKGNPVFFGGLVTTFGGDLALSPGGVLVRDAAGTVIGAVGVSGDTGPNDAIVATAGIAFAKETAR